MRVRGDLAPSGAFTLEPQPNRPGFVLVRFYENAVEYQETRDDQTTSGWAYDEYRLELRDTGSLEADIAENYEVYLNEAKAAEVTPESVIRGLEENKAEKAEVQAVWDSMAAAYQEGVETA